MLTPEQNFINDIKRQGVSTNEIMRRANMDHQEYADVVKNGKSLDFYKFCCLVQLYSQLQVAQQLKQGKAA